MCLLEKSHLKSFLEPELNIKWEKANPFRIPLSSQGPSIAPGDVSAYQSLMARLPCTARSGSVVGGCLHSGAGLSPSPLASYLWSSIAKFRILAEGRAGSLWPWDLRLGTRSPLGGGHRLVPDACRLAVWFVVSSTVMGEDRWELERRWWGRGRGGTLSPTVLGPAALPEASV